MGGTPSPRLPYPMQLGTGTYDLKSNVTYFDRKDKLGWGTQASTRIPLSKNEEGYRKGNYVEATAWLAYEPSFWRDISGQDSAIIAPVQTADPANHGGEQIQALFGVNLAGQQGWQRGHRLALEVGVPIYRNLNGPQLETDSTVTLGWQKAF